MADIKITDLSELTTPADADILEIVDDVAGTPTSKKVTVKNLISTKIPHRNLLVNGQGEHAQRGASGSASFTSATTPANSDDTYLIDRWILLSDGDDIVDVTQETGGGVSGKEPYIRLDVETAEKKFGLLQIIENKNCKSVLGGTASLSVEIKVTDATKLSDIRAVVLAWDSTADSVTSDIVDAWNAEGTRPTLVANWTAENTDSDLGVTTSWVRYEIENISIDTASAANIGVLIYQNNVATNDTAGKFLEITNIQLEKGSVATDFEYRDVGLELALCKRRFCKSYDQNVVPGTADTDGMVGYGFTDVASSDYTGITTERFLTTMAGTPSVTLYDEAGDSGKVTMPAGDGITGTADRIGYAGFRTYGTNGAATDTRSIYFHYTAEIEL